MTKYQTWSILLLRLGMGWLLFYSGISKVSTYFTAAKDWTASGFLTRAQGPFADLFTPLAGSVFVDYLNAYGQLLIGTALILGIMVRFSSFWGAVLMVLYWAAQFPPQNAFIVDDHIIYTLVLIFLAAIGAGRFFGLDKFLEKTNFVKSAPWLTKLLG